MGLYPVVPCRCLSDVVAIFLDRLLCSSGVMASCPFNPKYYRTFPVPLSNLAIVFGYDYYYYYYYYGLV